MKEEIFDNIADYSAEQVVEYIKQGIVTQEELENPDNTYGEYSAEVRSKVRELLQNAEPKDWERAQELDTVESYNQYLTNYPNGEHKADAEAAIAKLDDAAWEQACQANTIESYQSYLDNFYRGKYRDQARDAIAERNIHIGDCDVWNLVDKTSIADLERFIAENPQNFYVDEAKELIGKRKNKEEDEIWGQVDKKNINALREFVDKYPNGKYAVEARKRISELSIPGNIGKIALMNAIKTAVSGLETLQLVQNALNEKTVSVDEVLDLIEDDNNILSSKVIKKLIENGYITWDDLYTLDDIDHAFITQLAEENNSISFDTSDRPWSSMRNSTEIYFWGVPASGKTCALGAILSAAGSGEIALSMRQDPGCQGYDYMNRLPQCFKLSGEVTVLPAGTPVVASYEMGFDLIDKRYKEHPITCIDLAGEIIECMYKKQAGLPLYDYQIEALQAVTNFLGGRDEQGNPIGNRTKNRKIHFFVVEYGAENKLYKGLPQINYLNSTIGYIQQTGIFSTNTDAVFLIVTKVDKIKASSAEERIELLKQHVATHYRSFYNGLEVICRGNQINGGRVQVLPFSLGKVCFQDFCRLDAKYANEIVRIILERTHPNVCWLRRIFGR